MNGQDGQKGACTTISEIFGTGTEACRCSWWQKENGVAKKRVRTKEKGSWMKSLAKEESRDGFSGTTWRDSSSDGEQGRKAQ